MLAEKKRNTNIGVGAGLLMQLGGRMLEVQGGPMVPVGLLVSLAGTVVFIWGCVSYCRGKGHSGWLGLLGLLSILGLLVLVFLPDRHKSGGRPRVQTSTSPASAVGRSENSLFDTRSKHRR